MTGSPHPATIDLAAALRASVIPLSRALRRTDTELTPTQVSVLGTIYRNEPTSMGALAEHERLSLAMISRVVTSLVDQGLVDRASHPHDRRICLVQVSDAGHRWIDETLARRNAWLAERLDRLAADQRRTLADAVPLLELLIGDDGG